MKGDIVISVYIELEESEAIELNKEIKSLGDIKNYPQLKQIAKLLKDLQVSK